MRIAFLLGLCWALTIRAQAGWTVVSSAEISGRQTAVSHQHVVVAESETGARVELEIALCDLRKTTLRVIDQPNEPRSDLAAVMRKENALAGVNGGYFDVDDAPVGLLVSNSRVIAPLRKARLLSGIVSVTNGKIRVQRTAEFAMKLKPTEAIECGPFLVDHGKVVPGLDDAREARRTFVATANSNQVALGFCSRVSLAQLSQILVAIGNERYKIARALNLDGGSSSAFWFAGQGEPFSISEQKTVRDFLAVTPK